MKIYYNYTEYKDFPEATEISESRARNGTLLFMCCFLGLLMSFLLLFSFPEDLISGILAILFFSASLIYLVKFYPKATERKIQKAIEDSIKLKEEIATSKYKCRYIKVLAEHTSGTCNVCYEKNRALTLCKIKNDIGTRKIYTCDCCIRKFVGDL